LWPVGDRLHAGVVPKLPAMGVLPLCLQLLLLLLLCMLQVLPW
jgi:hypothetical protein